MNRSANNLLMLGITILVMGLFLMSYSISTYKEVKNLSEKIDFEEVDNNVQMSTSDKYFKYLSFANFLNQQLNKNKNLLIKNSACVYLDYAQHNAISLYKLAYSGIQTDDSRKGVAAGNVRTLSNMLDNYKTCNQTATYKKELENILNDIEKTDKLYSDRQQRMDSFLNGYNPNSVDNKTVTPQETEDIKNGLQNNTNPVADNVTDEELDRQLKQYTSEED